MVGPFSSDTLNYLLNFIYRKRCWRALLISFTEYLAEAKKKKKSRKDKFIWKDSDVNVTKAKVLKENHEEGTWENPAQHYDDYDKKKAVEIHNKLSEDAKNNHSNQEQIAINHYTGSGYKFMNHYLRHGEHASPVKFNKNETDMIEKSIHHLKNVTQDKTNHDFHAYRGFGSHTNLLHGLKKGDVIHDKGFTSATLKRNTSEFFSNLVDNRNKRVIAKIHIPKGTKGHYVSKYKNAKNAIEMGEGEFLLHHGTHFKVTGHSHDPVTDTHYVHMTVHKQDN